MKIISMSIDGLFKSDRNISFNFNDDINIITGRNGSGKTSAMKLMWYIISGNILNAIKEIEFNKVTIKTDLYECSVTKISNFTCRVEIMEGGERKVFEDLEDEDGNIVENAEDQPSQMLKGTGGSIFLPTFRRIEGGFTIESRRGASRRSAGGLFAPSSQTSDIDEALTTLSRRLSSPGHIFVASISTSDIVTILLRKYADLSEEYNRLQKLSSQDMIQKIREFQAGSGDENLHKANRLIDTIKNDIENTEANRDKIMSPMSAIKSTVLNIFSHSGIMIDRRLSFGDAANSISSDSLSAGEKQMLSFICYNALYKDIPIFIDEPELSLHVDWQRQLFNILGNQGSGNQFIISTHSPFIFSKYPEKELQIVDDRGFSAE